MYIYYVVMFTLCFCMMLNLNLYILLSASILTGLIPMFKNLTVVIAKTRHVLKSLQYKERMSSLFSSGDLHVRPGGGAKRGQDEPD